MKPAQTIIVLLLLLTAGWTTQAQTPALVNGNAKPVAQVTITFTFPSSAGDYSIYQDEGNKERFYIKFASASLPSYHISPAPAPVRLMVDNERSDQSSLVFWIPVLSGTAPRVDRSQSGLTLTFT